MKTILILFIFILTFPAFAGNVVLMSSLKVNKFVYFRMESAFKKAYKDSGRPLIIHREATPETLYKVLADEETEILIWVSHAGGIQNGVAGMASKGVIQDFYGNDVKNFFTTTTKNLKFLGIVGCSAESIIEGFRSRGHYDDRPDLEIKSYPEPVQLMTGLKETLDESLPHLERLVSPWSTFESDSVVTITTASVETPGTFSWLELGEKVYPLSKNIRILESDWSQLKNKNIKHINAHTKIELNSDLGKWTLFATKDGKPIGEKNKHLYVYKKANP